MLFRSAKAEEGLKIAEGAKGVKEVKGRKNGAKDADSRVKKENKEQAAEIRSLKLEIEESKRSLKAKEDEIKKLSNKFKSEGYSREDNARKKKLSEERLIDAERKLNKERMDMHFNLAVVYDKNGMYGDAEREYIKCLELDKDDPNTYFNLGILYDDKLNNNAKAMANYRKYLEFHSIGDDATKVREWLFRCELESRIGVEAR